MDEYISKQTIYDKVKFSTMLFAESPWDSGYNTAMSEMQIFVEHLPPAEVQLIKHGRWIDCTFYDPCENSWEQDYEFECNNCGHKIYNIPNDDNLFCGHCGARMYLEGGDSNG